MLGAVLHSARELHWIPLGPSVAGANPEVIYNIKGGTHRAPRASAKVRTWEQHYFQWCQLQTNLNVRYRP